jgi:hypothetical protein
MKLAARLLSALAVLAFATPALPCGDRATKQVTAEKEKQKSAPIAKSSEKKAKNAQKPAAEQKPVTAAN